MNSEEKESILKICRNYNDIFYIPGDKLSSIKSIPHEIFLKPGSKPVNVKPYRLPQAVKQNINLHVEKLYNDNIIEESISPFNSPLLLVPKKSQNNEKAWRLVVDFRRLNDITEDDIFPLPNISDILDQLGKSNYFTTLDLESGYHQIPLKDSDRPKTAFSTELGHYQFTRMPQGLKGAPATFQRCMNSVLSGLNSVKCFVYLDDIVIYGYDLKNHNDRLVEVFEKFRLFNIKLKLSKCHFLKREISYLGHVISDSGLKPDPGKISAIVNFPKPKNQTQIKSFLGICGYYRRFIHNYAKIAEPLIALLRKNVEFRWTVFCEESFNILKKLLSSPPILQFPDFGKTFYITTDASDIAIGSVLSQQVNDYDLPVAYASRVLNKHERNYSTIEKELLSIVWSVKRFRPYVYGRKFVIRTDHKPLIWLHNCSNPCSRLVHWRIDLSDYDYVIEYKSGVTNSNADALSRVVVTNQVDDNINNRILAVTRSKTKEKDNSESNENNDITNEEINFEIADSEIETNDNYNVAIKKSKTEITDLEEINKIIEEFHNSPLGAHQGVLRTYKRIKSYYSFPKMLNKIKSFIKKCKSCQMNKVAI